MKDFTEKQNSLENQRFQITTVKNDLKCTNVQSITKDKINAIVYTYNKDGRLLAIYYNGRSKKAKQHYYYRTEEQRAERIEDYFKNLLSWVKRDEEAKIKIGNQKEEMINKIQVGTLLHGSWGYDQTNCELYQVVAKTSKCKVVIREVLQKVVKNSEGFDCCDVTPIKNSFIGEERSGTISAYGIKLNRCCTLSPTNETQKHYSSWYA